MSMSTLLPLLGPHLPLLLGSTGAFFLVHKWTHTLGAKRLRQWSEFDDRTKNGIASHVVSMAHALVIIPLALRAVNSHSLAQDPVFGYDPFVGNVLAISSGYFIWDTVDSLRYSTIGFVIHGACCLAVYLFSFRPFLAGFGPPFLLWELSTPLLNIHWFMDKLGYATQYPTVFLLNALGFMLVFFLARIIYGGYESVLFFQVMWNRRAEIPLHLHLIYCIGNLSLNALNWLWFSKMVKKMLARVSGEDKPAVKGSNQSKVKKRQTGEVAGVSEISEKQPLLEKKIKDENGLEEEGEEDATKSESSEDSETLSLPADPPSPIASTKRASDGW